MTKKRNKYLLKNIIAFTISVFAAKLVNFFLIPLFTNTLSPSEYGIVDLLFTISNFLYPLITLNVSEAIYRFSMDKKNNANEIRTIGILCFLIAIIFGFGTIPIIARIPNYQEYAFIYYFHLITFSGLQILLSYIKGEEKLKLYSICNILYSICVIALNLIFLLVLKLKINGYFYSYIISNLIIVIFILLNDTSLIKMRINNIDKVLFKQMTKYSIVLIPTTFMWWIINSSDRIMVTYFEGEFANGIYALSYKFPSLLTTVASIFNQAWIFSAINEKNSEDIEEYTNNIFQNLFLIMSLAGLFILLIIKLLFKVIASYEYYNAWKYVPFLVIGFIFMTTSTFVSSSYNVHKDSRGFLISGLVGAIANIILNLLLIPVIGVFGAALSTCISYILVFMYRLIDTKKYINIKLNVNDIILLILAIMSSILMYINIKYETIFQLIILIIAICFNKKRIILIIKSLIKK